MKFALTFVVSSFLLWPIALNAQVPPILKIEAGDDTLAAFKNLPQDLEDRAWDLVSKLRPLLKGDINEYIDKVHLAVSDVASTAVDKIRCEGQGLLDATIGNWFAALFGVRQIDLKVLTAQDIDAVFQELRGTIDTSRAQFDPSSNPDLIALAYADLMYKVARVRCETVSIDQSGIAAESIKSMTSELFPPALEWRDLAGKCTDAVDCYDFRRKVVAKEIETADARDVARTNAKAAFDGLQVVAPRLPNFAERLGPVDI